MHCILHTYMSYHIMRFSMHALSCCVFWCLSTRWNIWWRWIAWSLWWLAQEVKITWNKSRNKWQIWLLECTCCNVVCWVVCSLLKLFRFWDFDLFEDVRRCWKSSVRSASCRGVHVKLWGGPASCFRRKDHWCSARGFGEYPEGTARLVANVGNSL